MSFVDPLFVQDFDWDYYLTFSGDQSYLIERDPTFFASGRASLHVKTSQYASTGDDVTITLYPTTERAKYREFLFTFSPGTYGKNMSELHFTFGYSDPATGLTRYYRIRIDLANNNIDIWTGAAWVIVGTYNQVLELHSWYTLRCWVNTTSHYWVATEFNGLAIDLSAYPSHGSDATRLYDFLQIRLEMTTDTEIEMWYDRVCVRGLDYLPL